jgi:hypothetical protein
MHTLSARNNPFSVDALSTSTKKSGKQSDSSQITLDGSLCTTPLPVTSMPGHEPKGGGAEIKERGHGRACALKALAGESLLPEDIAFLAKERQARVDFFAELQAGHSKNDICTVLHDIIAADGPESHWFLRKTAFEYLRKHATAPLTASLSALMTTKDISLRARILETLMNDLSFPLSQEARQEVSQLGVVGGQLCNCLLVDSPATGERPRWVSMFPRFVRAWILACSAVGEEHGVDSSSLNKFSRDMGGPLNDWQIRVAVEPTDPFTWGGVQAAVRRLVRL